MSSIDIFQERMAGFVYVDKRPFCYTDFLFFEHEGKDYKYGHGTIRNIFSELRKEGKIERVYKSTPAFYTLSGVKVGKSITPNHGGDHLGPKQRGFLQFLQNLPMDKDSILNIRLRSISTGLWSMLPSNSVLLAMILIFQVLDYVL